MSDAPALPAYVDNAWNGDVVGRPGPKRSADLSLIAAAAIEIADQHGIEHVSMRTVGRQLGMTSMALYRYFAGKQELLALVLDEAIGPPDFPAYGRLGWRARLTMWAEAFRVQLAAHTWIVDVPVAEPPLLPHQTRWTERGLDALAKAPLAESQKLSTLLLLSIYVKGQTKLALGLQPGPGDEPSSEDPGLLYARRLMTLADPDQFPRLTEALLANAGATETNFARDEFSFGVRTVLDGIAAIAERNTTTRSKPRR